MAESKKKVIKLAQATANLLSDPNQAGMVFGETAVDATHIKLFEGDLDQQVQLLSLVGKLQVEIL